MILDPYPSFQTARWHQPTSSSVKVSNQTICMNTIWLMTWPSTSTKLQKTTKEEMIHWGNDGSLLLLKLWGIHCCSYTSNLRPTFKLPYFSAISGYFLSGVAWCEQKVPIFHRFSKIACLDNDAKLLRPGCMSSCFPPWVCQYMNASWNERIYSSLWRHIYRVSRESRSRTNDFRKLHIQ